MTWTFTVRNGVKWSDGEPLTAADVAYTYNRILDGAPEQPNWLSYLKGVTSVTAPDATHRGAEAEEAERRPAAAADPDRARAHLEERQREGRSRATRRADGRQAGRRLRSVPAGRGHGRRLDVPFEANPDYWGGAPHIDEVVFRVYKNDGPAVQALIKGEIDFVEDITALAGQGLQGQAGHHRPQRQLARLRRDRLQHRLGRHQDRQADRRPQPGRARPEVPARARLRDRPCRSWSRRSTRAPACPATTIIPPAYTDYHWEPPADQAFTFDLDEGGPAARRGRLQEGLRRHADDARRQADRHAAARRALATRQTSLEHDGLLQGVARATSASKSEVVDLRARAS